MPKHNAQLFEFLAQHGWQWERDEIIGSGPYKTVRAWFRKGKDVRLLSEALWEVQMALGAPRKEKAK